MLKKKLVNKFVRKVKHKAKKQALLSIYGERSKLYRSEYNKICKDAQEYFRSASTPKEPESKVSASNLREEAAAALKPNMLKTIDSLHTTKQHGKLQLSDALHKTALHLVHAGDETTLYAVMSLSPGTLRKFLRFKKHLEDELVRALKSKDVKDDVGEIAKKVIKKLYKDLSFHHPYIIDRIKI